MIFMFQYEDQLMKENHDAIQALSANAQKAINSRLSNLRIRSMKASDFDAMTQHSVNEVVFVNRDGEIELWKGSVQL